MGETLAKYPRGAIGHGPGAMVEVENVKLTKTNNAKLKHTLARSPSGFTLGTNESELTFKMLVSETGPERDFVTSLKNGVAEDFRLLLPGGETWRITGPVSKYDIDVPLDDAVSVDLSVVCKSEKTT